jgi:hypothetical protein
MKFNELHLALLKAQNDLELTNEEVIVLKTNGSIHQIKGIAWDPIAGQIEILVDLSLYAKEPPQFLEDYIA